MLCHSRQLACLFGLAVALAAAPCLAANVDGKAGVGFEDTLTSVGLRQMFFASGDAPDVRPGGLAARYWLGNTGLEAIVGGSLSVGASLSHAGFTAIGAHYAAFRAPDVNMSIGARALFAWANTSAEDRAFGSRFGFAIEVPLRVEYFFTSAFAVAAAVGPVIHFPSPWRSGKDGVAGPVRDPLTTGTSTWHVSLSRGEFSGGLGFTYYFL